MDNLKLKTVIDNFRYAETEKKLTESISNGVVSEAAKLVTVEKMYITPQEAREIFTVFSGGRFDMESFAKFCSEIMSLDSVCHSDSSDLSVTNTVYLRNPLTDKAYETFSTRFTPLRAAYSHDFKSSCEDVYYDRADSCILPLENSSYGLLMPFRNMLIKYELKLAAVTNITSNEDDQQSLALVTGGEVDTDGNVLEAYVPSLDINLFPSLIEAAKSINCEVTRVTSVKSKNEGMYDHHICFTADSSSLSVLQYFLSAVSPAHIILGQYKNLISKGT